MKSLEKYINESIFDIDSSDIIDNESKYTIIMDCLNKSPFNKKTRTRVIRMYPNAQDESLRFEIDGSQLTIPDEDPQLIDSIDHLLKEYRYKNLTFNSDNNNLRVIFKVTRSNVTTFLSDKILINYAQNGTLGVTGGLTTTYKLDLSHAIWDAKNIEISVGKKGYDFRTFEFNSSYVDSIIVHTEDAWIKHLDAPLSKFVTSSRPKNITIHYDQADKVSIDTLHKYYPKYPKGPAKLDGILMRGDLELITGIEDIEKSISTNNITIIYGIGDKIRTIDIKKQGPTGYKIIL